MSTQERATNGEFEDRQQAVKNDTLELLERKCREKLEALDDEEDKEKAVIRRRNSKIYPLIGIGNSAYYSYAPHILIEDEFKSVTYVNGKGLKIEVKEFVEEIENQ